MNRINIALVIGSIIFFIFGIILSFISYKADNQKKYLFRNTFPYELNAFPINKRNIYGKICLFISFLSIGIFYCIYQNDMPSEFKTLSAPMLNGVRLVIAIVGVMVLDSIISTIFVPLTSLKYHLIIDYIFFAFCFALTVAMGICNIVVYQQTQSVYYLVFAILTLVISLGLLILIINPKLKDWARLEEKSNEDGTIIYVRPKYFVLAFTEWSFIFAFYISTVIYLFTLLFVK